METIQNHILTDRHSMTVDCNCIKNLSKKRPSM